MKNYTTKEVAELFGVSERTIQRHIATLIESLKNPLKKSLSIPFDIVNFLALRHGYDKLTTDSDNLSEQENDYPGVSSRKVKKTGLRIKSIMNYSFDSFYKLFILNGLNSPCLNVTLLFQT
jgi:hypothetical protein